MACPAQVRRSSFEHIGIYSANRPYLYLYARQDEVEDLDIISVEGSKVEFDSATDALFGVCDQLFTESCSDHLQSDPTFSQSSHQLIHTHSRQPRRKSSQLG